MQKLLIATTLLFAACHNPNYCAGNPDNNCNETGDGSVGSDGPEAVDCTVSGCAGVSTGGVCDATTKACVVCTATSHDACMGTAPVCSTTDTCRACVVNSECPSDTCMPDGSCAAAADVAYVDTSKSGTTCTQTDACPTIALASATNKSIMRVKGKPTEKLTVASSLTIIGDHDATTNEITSGLTYAVLNDVIITVGSSANLTMVDMALEGSAVPATMPAQGVYNGTAGTIDLIHCSISDTSQYGINSIAGTVNVHRTLITANKLAGIRLFSTVFDIDNSFIVNNGANLGTAVGGLSLASSHGTLAFSTIARNTSASGSPTGVACLTTTPSTFTSNIVYGNTNGPVNGDCGTGTWSYSDFDVAMPTGTQNKLNVLPAFIDADAGNFHLDAASALKDAGDASTTLKLDFDNQKRPMGAGPDVGADELQ